MTMTATRPASQKQLDFITKLLNERDTCGTPYAMHSSAPAGLTSRQASAAIDALLLQPKAQGSDRSNVTKVTDTNLEGMHKLGDRIFKVQVAVHGSGRLYAKELKQYGEDWSFEFAPGMIHKLDASTKMTLEEAKAFGALYGTCCVCGRTLTNETSIEEGIGPVCAGRF